MIVRANNCRGVPLLGGLLVWGGACTAWAGEGFVLIGNEATTRDMSVNLGADALRGEVEFGGRSIMPPSSPAPREEIIAALNHDSGVLDIQHTFFIAAALSSRILIHFPELGPALAQHCWSASNAPELRATLRMRVIGPSGPGKHNRLWGTSPSVHFPPLAGLDPPPLSVPIGVFTQTQPWIEGDGQNSFFTPTVSDANLLDVQRVGIAAEGTVWNDVAVPGVDLCLNRQPGLVAFGNEGQSTELCYDADPDWSPWMEWDVTPAVVNWLQQGFGDGVDHGFALYQYPGETVRDQLRISPEVHGMGRSRPVISFASSSGKADCEGAGGVWGGPGGVDFVYANLRCMTPEPEDFDPFDPFDVPRLIEPLVRPEWAPQLRIETIGANESCVATALLVEGPVNSAVGTGAVGPLELTNRSPDRGLRVIAMAIEAGSTQAWSLSAEDCLSGRTLAPGASCRAFVQLSDVTPGPRQATLVVEFMLEGDSSPRILRAPLDGYVSEDADGLPDAIENEAASEGDGNGDQIPDRQQAHVGSFFDEVGRGLTIEAPSGTVIEYARGTTIDLPDSLSGVQFDRGFHGYAIANVAPGAAVDIEMHGIERSGAGYYASLPEIAGPGRELQPFDFDGRDGAIWDDDAKTVSLIDGGRGDVDGQPDGRIVVEGALGWPSFATDDVELTDATVGMTSWRVWVWLSGWFAVVFGFALRKLRLEGGERRRGSAIHLN